VIRLVRWLSQEFLSGRFVGFLLAGGSAALVNMGSRIALSSVMRYVPAIVLAYVIGMGVAFVLNRLFVFGSSERGVKREVLLFAVVNGLAILQTVGVSVGLAWYCLPLLGVEGDLAETLGHVVGVMVPAFTSFLGHKYWTFARRR